jgi:inositol polyphosphate 5-phosphatase INPP5B/F
LNQKEFIFVRPTKGNIGPQESRKIEFTILVNEQIVRKTALEGHLDEILVLEFHNGRHIFISLQGAFQRTCFGLPLETLIAFRGKGVRNVPDTPTATDGSGGMPDELWRMTDFILKYGTNCPSLFLERGDERLCKIIRESLDTAAEFDEKLVSEGEAAVLSVAETVIRFLDALPTAIIPEGVSERALRVGEMRGSMMEVQLCISNLTIGDGSVTHCKRQCVDLSHILCPTDS